jgi:hypothetical protein
MINKEFFETLLARLKIFWMSLVMVFLVVSLQYLGVHLPTLFPQVSTKIQSYFHPTTDMSRIQTHAQVPLKGGE